MLDIKHNYPEVIINYLYDEIFVQKIYDFQIDNKKPLIIDCGANVGASIIFFKAKYPDAVIHAFEADSQTFQLLQENINKRSYSDVFLYNQAVSDKNGEQIFYTSNDKNELNAPIMSLFENELATTQRPVCAIDFGEFVNRFSVVDFCKMDVEGAESILLDSLMKNNSFLKIKKLVAEYHKWVTQRYDMDSFIEKFRQNNFNCKIVKEEERHQDYSTSGNAILSFTNTIQQ